MPEEVSVQSKKNSSREQVSLVKPLDDLDSAKGEGAKRKWLPKWLKISLIVLFILTLLVGSTAGFLAAVLWKPAKELRLAFSEVQAQAENLKQATKDQDLSAMDREVKNLKTSLGKIDQVLNRIAWVQNLPEAGEYWQDSKRLVNGGMSLLQAGEVGVTALTPYADLIGFRIDSETDQPPEEGKLSVQLSELVESKSGAKIEAVIQSSKSISAVEENFLKEQGLAISKIDGQTAYVSGYVNNLSKITEQTWVDYIYKGKSDDDGILTAEDRIQFVVNTLDMLVPQLDEISGHVASAMQNFSEIDLQRYPDDFRGIKVRNILSQIIDLTTQAKVLITDARPVLEVAPYILGNDNARRYLVLFQNDAELRPTGGFLTAYALMTVDKGKIEPGISRDIYDLDARYTSKTSAPQPLVDYIPDPYAKEKAGARTPRLRIRDSNLSPDFRTAMEAFYTEYEQTNSLKFDGIIAVDTQFLLELLKVTGPIGVGGIGNFSAEMIEKCNCPQVVYALEDAISFETPYFRENRKAIIGPLMHSVLANAMGTPKEKVSTLIQAGLKGIKEKHLLMYFKDEQVQAAIESFNLAGRIREAEGDYLMIVDTNFAGAKANLYVQEEVDLKVNVGTGPSIHELTITYKNPQRHDGWLNGDYPDWIRIYVPAGSKLLEESGSETEMKVSEEFGKTVFEGFLVLRPEGLAKLTVKYETPVISNNPYKLLIQKQGGTKNHWYMVSVDDEMKEFELDGDTDLTFGI
jgi:hypothetical protein